MTFLKASIHGPATANPATMARFKSSCADRGGKAFGESRRSLATSLFGYTTEAAAISLPFARSGEARKVINAMMGVG